MWQLGLSALFVLCGLASAGPGHAQSPAESAATSLVLVMESGAGLVGASQLRASLRKQFGINVRALGELGSNGEAPFALLAIAAERSRAVRVVYVDARGRRDTLQAPAPARRDDLPGVMHALASALLQRHLSELAQPSSADAMRMADSLWLDEQSRLDFSAFSRSLQAALSRIGYPRRRSGELSRSDF